jgi:hypothetical protein
VNNLVTPSESTRDSTETKTRAGDLANKPKSEKIRVELNIEKWPGIWQPAKGHTRLALRTLERQVELKGQGRAVSKLLIGFTELGTLTTEDQKMFYALIRQWEEAGKPVGKPVYFSDRLLSRLLRKKGWGTNVIEAMTGSLRRLRTIPLRWIKSFHKNDSVSSEYEEEIPFQILGDLKIITRKAHGHITNQQGYFQFDRNIEANLHANYTKPLLDEVFFKLESEIAQLLYTHIDLLMFGKTRYERCTKDLFADLGLDGTSYRFKSNRKQKLERALAELRGIRLNHGVLKSASIEETRDGKDYKVVFIKVARNQAEAVEAPALEPAPGLVVNHYARPQDPQQLQAEELVRYFHEVFHGVRAHEPQLKETNQALTLIAQHGLKGCRHIVEFARDEAAKTNFPIQHFGAVLSYASRALAEKNRKRQDPPAPAYRPLQPAQPVETDAQTTGERRLAMLTQEQFQLRFERAKAEIREQRPFLAHHWKDGNQTYERMIRARVIRQLGAEPMDLMISPHWLTSMKQNNRPAQNLPL